jgi:hypothetical protein
MYLYHYIDQSIGPFVNFSDLAIDEEKEQYIYGSERTGSRRMDG